MNRVTIISLLAFLFISGCDQSSKEESSSEVVTEETQGDQASEVVPAGEPITLHARLEFVEAFVSSEINSNTKLNASIYIETDVIREGSGASATYSLDDEESRVQGSIAASGSLALNNDGISSNETYNMSNSWRELTKNPEGKFIIQLPAASMVGEGLSVGVELEVPVSGVKKATISSEGQTIDSEITHSRSLLCTTKTTDSDICNLTFTIDAIPTKAQAPGYEHMFEAAKSLYAYQGKKGEDGGLVMYSSKVPVYGATTQYYNGHFVTELNQQYRINEDDSYMSEHIHLVVWSTKRGDNWQPEGLPPLQKN